jgi:hypothetical protein
MEQTQQRLEVLRILYPSQINATYDVPTQLQLEVASFRVKLDMLKLEEMGSRRAALGEKGGYQDVITNWFDQLACD